MDHASLYESLQKENTPFAYWLKEHFTHFPLAIAELLKQTLAAGITTFGKLSSKRAHEKYAVLLVAILSQSLPNLTVKMIQTSTPGEFQHQMMLALSMRNEQLSAAQLNTPRLGTLDTIPDHEFDQVRRFI